MRIISFILSWLIFSSISVAKQSTQKDPVEVKISRFRAQVESRLEDILKKWATKPVKLVLIAYKQQRILELWTVEPEKRKIKTYHFTAYSGRLGPKNKQGDRQIPEGIYHVNRLNPWSQYYLSIGLNYPNELDRKRGKALSIADPGGDIFIHGKDKTIGCIPVGDEAIEELFYLVHKLGAKNTKVLIAPTPLPFPSMELLGVKSKDVWGLKKYQELEAELKQYQNK